MGIRFFNKKAQTLVASPVFNPTDDTSISLRASVVSGDDVEKVELSQTIAECDFDMDLKYWERETAMMSVNNFDNSHFDSIVKMGEDAVPFIYKKLQESPTQLVHALELIYPDKVAYKGFVSLNQARRIWLKILKKQKGY